MEPKIITGLSNEDYHAHPALSASGLKLFMQAPAKYYAAYLDPNRRERVPTPAMKLGTATHCAILEPGEFDKRYVVMPEGLDRRTTIGKAQYAALVETGREILSADDAVRLVQMADSFHADPDLGSMFKFPYEVETSLFAVVNDVECKCRPDFSSGGMLMDVKSAADASGEGFGKAAINYGYHFQAAFYQRVYHAVYGYLPRFVFGVVESEYPYLTAAYEPPEDLLAYANEMIDDALTRFAECLRTGVWPGYGGGVKPLFVPVYVQRMIDNPEESVEIERV